MKWTVLLQVLFAAALVPASGAVVITEIAPWSSGNSPAAIDWFELTNTGASAVNIGGWKMDDNSNSFGSSVALRGVTSIAPGQSVTFFEGTATGSTDAAITDAFNSVWGTSFVFGTNIGAYGGSGVGLSTSGDAVNLYNSTGTLQANVTFGDSPAASPFATFDNSVGLNNTAISTLSVSGVHGAFAVIDTLGNTEIGSPGTISAASAPVPEPATSAAAALGLGAITLLSRRVRK